MFRGQSLEYETPPPSPGYVLFLSIKSKHSNNYNSNHQERVLTPPLLPVNPQTPETSPQRDQRIGRSAERMQRILNSPEHRRMSPHTQNHHARENAFLGMFYINY